MGGTRTDYGVRYPDGAVQPVSSAAAAKAHARAGNEHAEQRARELGTTPRARLVPVTCERTPWVELAD